jgi:hypothetical protein
MSREEDIDYDALDEISKKYDMVLEAFENQKTLTLAASIKPSLAALKNELEGVDGLNDSFLNSLIAQHLKALDDQYLIDEKMKQYLRTWVQELSDELRSVYSKVKQMEIGLQGSKTYQAQKRIENDEGGVRAVIEEPAPIPFVPKIPTAKIGREPKEVEEEVLPPSVVPSPPPIPILPKLKISASDKIKLVKAAYINLPEGTRTTGNIQAYVMSNYHMELKTSTVGYLCRRLNLGLEGNYPRHPANNEEQQEKNG